MDSRAEQSVTGEPTLGTDPWQTPAAPGPDLDAAEEALVGACERFEAGLDGALDGSAEAERLREVVRRLERRVRELEAALDQRDTQRTEARRRLDRLTEELRSWKQSAPSA